MSHLSEINAALVTYVAPIFCTRTMHWVALLFLCGAYLQGSITKAFDFAVALDEMNQFGLRPAAPFAMTVILMEMAASALVLSGFFRWVGALMLGGFTLCATFVADRFWNTRLPKRNATENAFFEHLGLVGGFILVAWYDLQG